MATTSRIYYLFYRAKANVQGRWEMGPTGMEMGNDRTTERLESESPPTSVVDESPIFLSDYSTNPSGSEGRPAASSWIPLIQIPTLHDEIILERNIFSSFLMSRRNWMEKPSKRIKCLAGARVRCSLKNSHDTKTLHRPQRINPHRHLSPSSSS